MYVYIYTCIEVGESTLVTNQLPKWDTKSFTEFILCYKLEHVQNQEPPYMAPPQKAPPKPWAPLLKWSNC